MPASALCRITRLQPLEVVIHAASRPLRYLSYTLDPNSIRKQDATSTINSIASNVVGQSLAWDFVQSNWKKIFQE